jgi:uncharacterized membrane protein YeiH
MVASQTSTLLHAFDLAGVAVSATSGALAAGRRHLDLLGVVVVATVTAIGGGTIRDVLLDRYPVFWIARPGYLTVILAAAAVTMAYTRFREPPAQALQVADAFALGLFTMTGAQIAEGAELAGLLIIVMGTITAVAGGVVRDVLCTEIPLVMRSGNLYASAAIAGATAYVWLRVADLPVPVAATAGMLLVVALRLAAIVYDIRLPVYSLRHPEGP